MFLDNKYTKLYFRIIDQRRRIHLPKDSYGENHHIIPHSFGGKKDPNNLVRLTAREHFLVHALLIKMCEGRFKAKMVYALHMMGWKHESNKRYINSKLYEKNKIRFSEIIRNDEERKQKISKTTKGVYVGVKHSQFGKKQTKEHREKAARARTGLIRSQEFKDKMSKLMKGVSQGSLSLDHKKKISVALSGIPKPTRSEEHKKNISLGKRGKKIRPSSPESIKLRNSNRLKIIML